MILNIKADDMVCAPIINNVRARIEFLIALSESKPESTHPYSMDIHMEVPHKSRRSPIIPAFSRVIYSKSFSKIVFFSPICTIPYVLAKKAK
jgi:hypothetical protein